MSAKIVVSRRTFVKSAGGLVIGFSFADPLVDTLNAQAPSAAAAPQTFGPPLARIDSWLRIAPNGHVSITTGKVEIGQGVDLALRQIVAEELDVPLINVSIVMGDTSATPDQGGVGASNAISSGGPALRNVAATVRGALVQAASRRLQAPIDQLQIRDGVVLLKSDPSKSIAYGALVGEADLSEALKVTGSGFSLVVQGSGKPKDPATYSIVGKPVRRTDIAEKLFGTFKYVGDVRVPGMLHGRVIRPAGVGSRVLTVDDTAAKKIGGFVQAVVKGDFVGVVAESEWGAVRAAEALKVTWSSPATAFPEQRELYAQMRSAKPRASRQTAKRGDAAAAMLKAVKKVEATYNYPFHSHATMGPGCAVADVQMNGVTTVWSGTQKPHAAQRGFADLIGVPPERLRIVWVEDSGTYGRPFDDVGADALLLSQAVGKPVRVQWMRSDLTAWAPKGPAATFELRAGLDADGNVSGLEFASWALSGGEINFVPNTKGNFIGAQLTGLPNTTGFDEFADWGGSAPAYTVPELTATAHIVPSFHAPPSPLAGTHLRDPNGPSTSFAVESFMDELATAAGLDPVQFRLKYIDQERARAVLTAACEKYGWQPRRSPNPDGRGDTRIGRGVSLGVRLGTYVGNVAEVEVNRRTGVVRITKFVMAHDCGLVINPLGLTQTLQANVMQTLSRTLKEEVQFDRSRVTSGNWATYPVARMSDLPPAIEIVVLNRPDLPSTGAGEAGTRALAAAVANAIFDATGVRVRQVPFTPERLKAALV